MINTPKGYQPVFTNHRDKQGNFPIHCAVSSQSMDEVHHLLTEGTNPSIKNRGGMTPLHLAAIMNNNQIWNCLLDFGANPFILNDNNQLPSDVQQNVAMRERLYTRFCYTACNDLVSHLQLSKSQRFSLYPAIRNILETLDHDRHLRPDDELTSQHMRQSLINAMVTQFRPYVKKDWRGRHSIPIKKLKQISENATLLAHLIYDTYMSFINNRSHGQYTEVIRTINKYNQKSDKMDKTDKKMKKLSRSNNYVSKDELFEPTPSIRILGQNSVYHVQSAPDLPPPFLLIGRRSLDE